MSPGEQLEEEGWALVSTGVSPEIRAELRDSIFIQEKAGTRCLLDVPAVREVACQLKNELAAAKLLSSGAIAIQAIAFDKTPDTNWKVAWHQDLMFPTAEAATASGYDLPVKKAGIHYARPPLQVVEDLLAVRLHLDVCGTTNGPLRICPGSHRHGFIPSPDCTGWVTARQEKLALAAEGEAILMRPLLLHASSQATVPAYRRVLHLVYHSGEPVREAWHRSIG
ncbi:phytanoyl-CoA dioxygenase family protein [Luteolibacter luteus]|uniref:Phytanoyl-CoA dioxygenase family protein n=1 Tax=Luteolibacter luteus TaxID=2728835 RepID=A0A858RLG0_9BACT|nr:phytanoyl-CoA dioxygenase family protein [Luteolibacter luteus]QJE97787.1 phytanoyl-CoA dioxygenase family protein [Luteolibacter luteus]